MRKILFVMVAALAFVACEKDYQSVIEKTDLETVVHNNKVSLKQALLYAENSINGNSQRRGHRGIFLLD